MGSQKAFAYASVCRLNTFHNAQEIMIHQMAMRRGEVVMLKHKNTRKTVQAVHPGGWMHIHPMYVEYLCKKKQATLRAIFSTV